MEADSVNSQIDVTIEIVPDDTDMSKLDKSKMYMTEKAYQLALKESTKLKMPLETYIIQLLRAQIARDVNSKGADVSVD